MARDPVEVARPLGTPLGLAQRKRRLDSLEAAQGAPRHPRRDSRGKRVLALESREGTRASRRVEEVVSLHNPSYLASFQAFCNHSLDAAGSRLPNSLLWFLGSHTFAMSPLANQQLWACFNLAVLLFSLEMPNRYTYARQFIRRRVCVEIY